MKQDPVQLEAHGLLQEWAGGFQRSRGEGCGYPPAPTHKAVQNARSSTTSPERFAFFFDRWSILQSAVADVSRENPNSGLLIWDSYYFGHSDQHCAERAGISLRTWYKRRDEAREMFLRAYCQRASDPPAACGELSCTREVDAAALQN